jgi:hypothetical protein
MPLVYQNSTLLNAAEPSFSSPFVVNARTHLHEHITKIVACLPQIEEMQLIDDCEKFVDYATIIYEWSSPVANPRMKSKIKRYQHNNMFLFASEVINTTALIASKYFDDRYNICIRCDSAIYNAFSHKTATPAEIKRRLRIEMWSAIWAICDFDKIYIDLYTAIVIDRHNTSVRRAIKSSYNTNETIA